MDRFRTRASDSHLALNAGGTAAGIGLTALLWHYFSNVVKPTRIVVGEGSLKQDVLPHCGLLLKPFRPTLWAFNTHMQTALGLLRTASIIGRYNRQLIMASDGGTLGLDWWMACDHASFGPCTTPIFLVLHGINGGSHEGYCKWACAAAARQGWRSVVLNYRGCNGLPMTSPRGYNASGTNDVFIAIASIRARFPGAPVFAAGYSLGGVILTKYLAEADSGFYEHPSMGSHGTGAAVTPADASVPRFEGSGLVAAAVVSSPVCLTNSSLNIGRPWTFNYLYNLAVAYKLREHIAHHQREIVDAGTFNIDAALNAWTIQEVEDVGLPAQFGFRSRMEYYETASSLKYLPLITTPTLLLTSTDDPFLGVLPDLECAANPSTLLAATSRGGHVAFLQGLWPLGQAFMDDVVMQFLEATRKHYRPAAVTALKGPACDSAGSAQDMSMHHGSQHGSPDGHGSPHGSQHGSPQPSDLALQPVRSRL